MENFPIYTPVQLLGSQREDNGLPMFWKNLAFGGTPIFSDDRKIQFSKISSLRRVAPFVQPTSDGVPIYNNRETVEEVSTAYIKLKDSVKADEFTGRREVGAGELGGAGQRAPLTPHERWKFRVAEITAQHETAINNTIEIMCFQALADGIVQVKDDEETGTNAVNNVNFGRDSAHTITLTGTALWTNAASDPIANLSSWRRIMQRPTGPNAANRFKARFTMLVMGVQAAEAFRTNAKVQELLNTETANMGDKTIVNADVLDGLDIELIGVLRDGTPVWSYNEYYEDADGEIEAVMDPRDVIALNPTAVKGEIAYGSIANFKAELGSRPVFPNMFSNLDGSQVFLSHESAPMVIPVNPNATLRARVVA